MFKRKTFEPKEEDSDKYKAESQNFKNSSNILQKSMTFFFYVVGNKPSGEDATWNSRQGIITFTFKIVSLVILDNSSDVSGGEDKNEGKTTNYNFLYENHDIKVFLIYCQGGSRYDDWALKKECNILETLLEFPSVQATADLLLTQLPALQPVSLPCNAISICCLFGNSNLRKYRNILHVNALPLETTFNSDL